MPAQDECFLLLIDDGRPGHWRQVGALAKAIGVPARRFYCPLRWPHTLAAPRRLPFWKQFHGGYLRSLPRESPLAVIACGRRSAVVSLGLRDQWQANVAHIQLLDCGLPTRYFNRVIVPRHDGLDGENVISVTGSLNPLDENVLNDAMAVHPGSDTGQACPVAVILGGPTRRCRIGMETIAAELEVLGRQEKPREVEIVATPRTPGKWVDDLASHLSQSISRLTVLDWPAPDNRYFAALARAGHLFVTADSVNLLSEACACGKAVYILGKGSAQVRIKRFCDELLEAGHAHLPARFPALPDTTPLREASRVAAIIRESGLLGQYAGYSVAEK